MKHIIFLFTLMSLQFTSTAQVKTFQGTISFEGIRSDNDVIYSSNILKVIVDAKGEAICTINLKLISKTDPDDYFLFSGRLNGHFLNNDLTATGQIDEAIKDDKHFASGKIPTEIKGTDNGSNISGIIYLTLDGKKQNRFTFTITPTTLSPELLFPLGESPKVFNKGWLFGARFIITNDKGEELNLSDKIEWSGTAKFEPLKGSTNRPVFKTLGVNKIILSVKHDGKEYKKEYSVSTVEATLYARVNSLAFCLADGLGCPSDPHPVIGPVLTGNSNVLIEGLPAACEGDIGIHAVCCGPCRFIITDGDPEVLINGKKAATKFSPTQHCRGQGKITDVGTVRNSSLLALSDDVSITNNGKRVTSGSQSKKGTKIETGKKGMLMINPDYNTIVMLLPNSKATITNISGKNFFIDLQEGSLMLNSHTTDSNKNFVVETDDEKLVKKGTRYLFTRTNGSSKLIVYEGEVEVHFKNDNTTIHVPSGKSYFNDFKSSYIIKDTVAFESSSVLMTIPKDSLRLYLEEEWENTTKEKNNGIIDLFKKYWYAGGGLIVLLLLFLGIKKRKIQQNNS